MVSKEFDFRATDQDGVSTKVVGWDHEDDVIYLKDGCSLSASKNSYCIEQFTGKTASDGTKIYEGDILILDKDWVANAKVMFCQDKCSFVLGYFGVSLENLKIKSVLCHANETDRA